MTRCLVVLLCALPLLAGAPGAIAGQIAVSLRVAQALSVNAGPPPQVRSLAGMTRLIGAVNDSAHGDLILVGEIRPDEPPLTLDDFAVMLRACVHGDCAPLVSIDATPETPRTHLQTVRYEGGIAGTPVGQALFDADRFLKLLALGKETLPGAVLPSYFDLIAEKLVARRSVASRFWFFVPDGTAAAISQDSVALLALPIGVRIQMESSHGTTAGPQDRDEAGELFVRHLNDNAAQLLARPEIERLQVIMGLAVVARVVGRFSARPNLQYWTAGYQPASVAAPREYALISRQETVHHQQGELTLRLDGGVDLHAAIRGVHDGSLDMLRLLVLASRPTADTLTWPVALDAWPGVQGGPVSAAADTPGLRERLGTTIYSRVSAVPSGGPDIVGTSLHMPLPVLPQGDLATRVPPGGVKIGFEEMVVRAGISPNAGAALSTRPSGDALTWPGSK